MSPQDRNSNKAQKVTWGRVTQFKINKKCTHCAIVRDLEESPQPGRLAYISKLQQLWNTVTGERQWNYVVNLDLRAAVPPPSFSPDDRYVGFFDLNGVNLIRIQADNTIQVQKISFVSRHPIHKKFSRLSVGPAAARIALVFEALQSGSGQRASLQSSIASNGRTTIDSIHVNAVDIMADYYSEDGKYHYS